MKDSLLYSLSSDPTDGSTDTNWLIHFNNVTRLSWHHLMIRSLLPSLVFHVIHCYHKKIIKILPPPPQHIPSSFWLIIHTFQPKSPTCMIIAFLMNWMINGWNVYWFLSLFLFVVDSPTHVWKWSPSSIPCRVSWRGYVSPSSSQSTRPIDPLHHHPSTQELYELGCWCPPPPHLPSSQKFHPKTLFWTFSKSVSHFLQIMFWGGERIVDDEHKFNLPSLIFLCAECIKKEERRSQNKRLGRIQEKREIKSWLSSSSYYDYNMHIS